MDELLQEITALPKVLGCFLYSGSKGVTYSSMPPNFTEDAITVMGTLLARAKQMSKEVQLDLEAIDLRYKETIIIARPMDHSSVLVTICELGANRPLLDMSINMVINDVKEGLDTTEQVRSEKAKNKSQAESVLRPILAKLKEELTLTIGPLATPILKDCLKEWSTQGPPAQKRLPDLAMLICREIDDEILESTFMEKIKKFF